MSIAENIGVIRDIVTIIALLFGGLLGIFVFFQLAPVIQLRIIPNWTDETKQYLLIRFEIENKSRVRVTNPGGKIQVLEHKVTSGAIISNWVPFEEKRIKPEEPVEWREPVKIFEITKQIFPGEIIVLERLYHVPQNRVILHIGLQVELELSFIGRLVTRKREPWRQTTTCFAIKNGTGKTT